MQHVEVVEDAEAGTRRFLDRAARALPPEALPSLDDALSSPFVLIGTVDDIVTKVGALGDRWGITRYTTRSFEAVATVIRALAG